MNDIKANYVEKSIKEIDENTLRVRILGKIIEKIDDLNYLIDDGSGTIKIIMNNENKQELELSKPYFVFGKVVPLSNEVVVFVDFIRDVGDLNLKLYRKVKSL